MDRMTKLAAVAAISAAVLVPAFTAMAQGTKEESRIRQERAEAQNYSQTDRMRREQSKQKVSEQRVNSYRMDSPFKT
jgi:hypothetical protein